MASDCEQRNVTLNLTNLAPSAETDLREVLTHHDVDFFYATLNDALQHAEDILVEQDPSRGHNFEGHILSHMEALLQEHALEGYVDEISLETGAMLMEYNMQSKDIYLLRSGQLTVSVPRAGTQGAVVAQIRPGSVIGEMAYYSGRSRSADIVADAPSELLRVDMGRMAELEAANPRVAAEFHRLIARDMARRLNRTTMLLRDLGL